MKQSDAEAKATEYLGDFLLKDDARYDRKHRELTVILVTACPEAPEAGHDLPTPPSTPDHTLPTPPAHPDQGLPGGPPPTAGNELPEAPDRPDNELPEGPDKPEPHGGTASRTTTTTIHKKK